MGYDLDRFEQQVDEEFICPICCMVLEDTVEAPCQHVFCSGCINQWLDRESNCPSCRERVVQSDLRPGPRSLRNLLGKLEIKCDFGREGCRRTVKLEHLAAHIRECDYNPRKMVKCTKGCEMELQSCQMSAHSCVKDLRKLVDELRTEQKRMFEEFKTALSKKEAEMSQLQNRVEQMLRITGASQNEATIQYRVLNITSLNGMVLSHGVFVQNFEWKIKAKHFLKNYGNETTNPSRSLGFYLCCHEKLGSRTWRCTADVELRLISQKDGVKDIVERFQRDFTSESFFDSWGIPNFIRWDELMDPARGFIKEDSILLEVRFRMI